MFATPHAVVLLDGASAFVPVPVSPAAYAEQLGMSLRNLLLTEPQADLRLILSQAIAGTAEALHLVPGRSPSSTVTIARQTNGRVNVLALGDSVAILPHEVVTDERMDALDLEPRRVYRERLMAGHGYGAQHRETVRELQRQQAAYRNRDGGYWIAEADPNAAQHALLRQYGTDEVPWLVLASDGAYNTMSHLRLNDWAAVARMSTEELHERLNRCQAWEAEADPDGKSLPRAKRHDDKSLAAVLLDT